MKNILAFTIFFLTTTMSVAAPLCADLFRQSLVGTYLKEKDLKKNNFAINDDNQLIDLKSGLMIGRVWAESPPYLYEWAPLSFHKTWVEQGGITKDYLAQVMLQKGQSYGRGYYVSTNPFDSENFGGAITVFKTRGPVIRLSFQTNIANDYPEDPVFLKRLEKAGFDAIGYHPTWLSMISTRHLEVETGPIRDPAWNDPANFPVMYAISGKIQRSGYLRQIPKEFPNTEIKANALVLRFINELSLDQFLKKYAIFNDFLKNYGVTLSLEYQTKLRRKIRGLLVSSTPIQKENALRLAVQRQDFVLLAQLIRLGIDPNWKEKYGSPLISLAAQYGQIKIMKDLIKAGANVDDVDYSTLTPLMIAALVRNFEAAKILVEAGCDLNQKDEQDKTALDHALSVGAGEVTNYLQSLGAF